MTPVSAQLTQRKQGRSPVKPVGWHWCRRGARPGSDLVRSRLQITETDLWWVAAKPRPGPSSNFRPREGSVPLCWRQQHLCSRLACDRYLLHRAPPPLLLRLAANSHPRPWDDEKDAVAAAQFVPGFEAAARGQVENSLQESFLPPKLVAGGNVTLPSRPALITLRWVCRAGISSNWQRSAALYETAPRVGPL